MRGSGKMRNGLGLELGSGVMIRVMSMALVGVRIRVLFCSSIAQFVAILRILHCAD